MSEDERIVINDVGRLMDAIAQSEVSVEQISDAAQRLDPALSSAEALRIAWLSRRAVIDVLLRVLRQRNELTTDELNEMLKEALVHALDEIEEQGEEADDG